jgi:fluoride exporter
VTVWALLALGGAAGAVARYVVAGWIHQRMGATFPWGTLAVNLTGSFLLGAVLTGLATSGWQIQLGAFLAIGFLGDFTTFSTFSYETVMLARDRQWTRALSYVVASTVLAMLAIVAGMVCGAVLR